jgi:NAD(P)-dependent dehydrogenase (short-subunit alcohol dehydrogenase family)
VRRSHKASDLGKRHPRSVSQTNGRVSMGRLDGKVAIITGAGSGVGRATMVLFAREGASVVGAARTQKNLDETLRLVEQAGGKGVVVSADLATDEGAEKMTKAAVAAFGGVDILVNNAGVGWSYGETRPGSMNPLETTTPELWNDVVGINLGALYLCSRRAIPEMRKRGGGAIVNISSVAGTTSLVDAHAYVACKGAIISLTRGLGQAYVKDGIRTNCVAPGFIDTPMIAPVMSAFDDPIVAELLCPMKRAAEPEEIANAILFFASDESSYCNGATLAVDGGSTIRMFALPPVPEVQEQIEEGREPVP